MRGAIYVSDSKNIKIGLADATYLSIDKTCPNSCVLKNSACYAQEHYVGMIVKRLDKEAKKQSALQVARAEAKAIDSAYGGKEVPKGRNLRIHVAGDSRTIAGSRIINHAVGRWKNRGGNIAWQYTHAWGHVPRNEWSNVSILASIDKASEIKEARAQGYAPAIVVSEFETDKAFTMPGSDVKFIPCPAQTRDNVSCVSCRLCFNADRLYRDNFGIAFAAHGIRKGVIKKRLTVIQ